MQTRIQLSYQHRGTLEGSRGSTPEASTPASLQTTPSGIRSPSGDDRTQSGHAAGSPSPPRLTLQLAADRLAALREGERASAGAAAEAAGTCQACSRGSARAGGGSSAAEQATATSCNGPPAGAAADHLLTLADQAQLVQGSADVLREGLRGARRQLAALHRQLASMQRQALRQQHVLGSLLVEQECEVKLARSEAEAYRTAARARTAAVSTLQR